MAWQRYLPVVALFTLANSSNPFLLLRARELKVPQAQIPLLWAAISAVAMVGSIPLAAWPDRIVRRGLPVAGYGSYGLFLSATEGVEKALVSDLAEPGSRGTAFGWFKLITGSTVLPASWIFGWLFETFSSRMAFSFGAACAGTGALALAVIPSSKTRPP